MGEVLRRTKGGKFLGYYLRFYEDGRRRILASRQPSFAEARRMLIGIEARIARGEKGVPERSGARLSVRELVELFLVEYSRPRLKDLESYREATRHSLKKPLLLIGELPVDRLTPADVGRVRDALRRELGPGTVKTYLDRLSIVLSWGVRRGLLPSNPCRDVERPRAPGSLDFLSYDEVRTLLSAASERTRTLSERMRSVAITIAVHTGLRKGELFGLRWTDLDLDTQRLTVARSFEEATKSGKSRHLRIPSAILPVLTEWRSICPQTPGGTVLPIGRTGSRTACKGVMLALPELMQELGLRKVRHPWHLLRHTFASHFVMSGGNILALQKILGHSDLKMTMIYAHLAPDFLGHEMERVRFSEPRPKRTS